MNVTVPKVLLALAATSTLLVASAIVHRRRRSIGSALQFLGAACFVIVALTHVFEAFEILPVAGWGQPRSFGHYIDLGAAVLGITLGCAGLFWQYGHHTSRAGEALSSREDR
jgi:hypothetical protein